MTLVIGDVHGRYDKYLEIINSCSHSVQLGDFGFKYEILKDVDPTRHLIIGGNHENYDEIIKIPNYIGDFGYTVNFNGIDFFYFRGAYSIDRQYRTIGIDWWEQEQVSIEKFMEAREIYRSIKPDIVLTHDCPESVAFHLISPFGRLYQNNTSWALQELFNIHQPKLWLFGHHHRSWKISLNGTNFQCLNELETFSLT